MVTLTAKRSTVLSIVAAIITDLFDGWYSLIAGTRRLRFTTSSVLGRKLVHPPSPTDRRIVRCRSDGKPWLHRTITAILSNPSIPLPGGLAIESSSSLVRRHDERRRSQGALRFITWSPFTTSLLSPLLSVFCSLAFPLAKGRRRVPVHGGGVNGMSRVVLQTAADTALLTDGELAYTAFL